MGRNPIDKFGRLTFASVLTLVATVLSVAPEAVRAAAPQPVTHLRFNGLDPILQSGDGGAVDESQYVNPLSPICSTPTSSAANVDTDCEGTAAHNETTIAVNPKNPLNQIVGANDYEVRPVGTSGAIQYYVQLRSRAHVTFDGGRTWITYPIDFGGYNFTGDPAVAFDAMGNSYYATLGFKYGQGAPAPTSPDVLVAQSRDGGETWSKPVQVAAGTGSAHSVGVFNDKEYLAAWGNGNAIVAWDQVSQGSQGSYISSPIFASVTHDGATTWSTPVEISGSAAFCIGAQGGNACDQSGGAVPVVAADGSIYVAFLSPANLTTGRNQYLVVKVDPATGARIAGPFKVADLIDGFTDYPINVDGRSTYQDSEFRSWAGGNIAADPTNAAHLTVVWSDMRNSTLPAAADPYAAVTNSDVVISQSFDAGVTWSAPTAITVPGDQFMPWGAYDSGGRLSIGYFDRSYDPANQKYGYTLATEKKPGSLKFTFAQLSTVLSDPTQGDRWFSGGVVNNATVFLGDYSGIATIPSGGVAAAWTDMRNNVCFATRCGAGEDVFYATAP